MKRTRQIYIVPMQCSFGRTLYLFPMMIFVGLLFVLHSLYFSCFGMTMMSLQTIEVAIYSLGCRGFNECDGCYEIIVCGYVVFVTSDIYVYTAWQQHLYVLNMRELFFLMSHLRSNRRRRRSRCRETWVGYACMEGDEYVHMCLFLVEVEG